MLNTRRRAALVRFGKALAASVFAGIVGFLTSDQVREIVSDDPLLAAILPVVVAAVLGVEKYVRWFKDEEPEQGDEAQA